MSIDSNFANFLTKKLSALSLTDKKSTGINFESLAQMSKSLSVFENSDISALDYEAIAKALNEGSLDGIDNGGTKVLATMMSEILSVDGVAEKANISEAGEIDAAEIEAFLQELIAADGDKTNLTMKDVDALFEKMGISLDSAAETAVNEVLDEIKEKAKEEELKKQEELDAQNCTNQTAPNGSTPSVGGTSGGSRASGVSGSNAAATKKTQAQQSTAETVAEIKSEIQAKNDEISEVESDADAQIAEQEAKKEEAMKQAGVSEKEYEEYKKQADEKDEQIKEKESEISKKDDEIKDYNSTISSNENYIGSIESQISENKSKLGSISGDDDKAASKKSEIESKISNLEAKKEEVQKENDQLKEKIQQAETDKKNLETQKQKLETEKQELLTKTLEKSEGFAKGVASSEAVGKMKDSISEYDNKISKIKSDRDTKVSELKGEIQTLEVKLKDAEMKEEREEFLKDNKATMGLGLTGEELVDVAKQMLNTYGESRGWCATGVSRTFAMAYGLQLNGNGCDWDTNMDGLVQQGAFEEVTGDYPSSDSLSNLPAGAVVCWEATGGSSGGAKYGHVTIADGKGGEISDHYAQNIYKSIGGRSDQYRVYIPV